VSEYGSKVDGVALYELLSEHARRVKLGIGYNVGKPDVFLSGGTAYLSGQKLQAVVTAVEMVHGLEFEVRWHWRYGDEANRAHRIFFNPAELCNFVAAQGAIDEAQLRLTGAVTP